MIAYGSVLGVERGLVRARFPGAALGGRVRFERADISGTVVALHENGALIACDGTLDGIAAGMKICAGAVRPRLGAHLAGKTLAPTFSPLLPPAPQPSERVPLDELLWTGVRVIDGLLPFARGARIGIFGPPGAGKSTLLHAIARHARADVAVIALVGERGREAEEWTRHAPRHATLVCATSDRSSARRIAAAHTAMAQADALCRAGLHVLLITDSLARYAYALREQAVAAGEPAGRAGYPASVFAQLARFVEVAGARRAGSLTFVATVLSDGDERDPVSDAARSLLDGHLQLSAARAAQGLYPAIDVLASASRTSPQVCTSEHLAAARKVRAVLAQLERTRDARLLGLDAGEGAAGAAAAEAAIERFLCQGREASPPAQTLSALAALADTL